MKSGSLVAFCFLLGPFPAELRAEIATAESIEWVVADSDRVVVGKVVKVTTLAGAAKKPFEVATVKISQTLKGRRAKVVTFLLRNYNPPVAGKWLKLGVPMLFCLVSSKHAARDDGAPLKKVGWVLRDNGNQHCAILLGKADRFATCTIEAFTKDFEVVTAPDRIMQ